jgi:hypothetical protein
MEKTKKGLLDGPKATIDPNLKSGMHNDSPFIKRKMKQARKTLAGVDLSILGIPDKF